MNIRLMIIMGFAMGMASLDAVVDTAQAEFLLHKRDSTSLCGKSLALKHMMATIDKVSNAYEFGLLAQINNVLKELLENSSVVAYIADLKNGFNNGVTPLDVRQAIMTAAQKVGVILAGTPFATGT